jgi:hypothetical protein
MVPPMSHALQRTQYGAQTETGNTQVSRGYDTMQLYVFTVVLFIEAELVQTKCISLLLYELCHMKIHSRAEGYCNWLHFQRCIHHATVSLLLWANISIMRGRTMDWSMAKQRQ